MINPFFMILNTHLDIVDNGENYVTTFIKTLCMDKLKTVNAVCALVFYSKQGNASKTGYFLPFSRYRIFAEFFSTSNHPTL